MAPLFEVSAEAQNDLFEIWQRVAEDSLDLANRISKANSTACLRHWAGCLVKTTLAKAHGTSGSVFPAIFFPSDVSAGCESDSHHGDAARQTQRKSDSERAPCVSVNPCAYPRLLANRLEHLVRRSGLGALRRSPRRNRGSVPRRRFQGLAVAVDGGLDVAGEVAVRGSGGVFRHKGRHFGDSAVRWRAGWRSAGGPAQPPLLCLAALSPARHAGRARFGFRHMDMRHIPDDTSFDTAAASGSEGARLQSQAWLWPVTINR
jgi:hypothetical protein